MFLRDFTPKQDVLIVMESVGDLGRLVVTHFSIFSCLFNHRYFSVVGLNGSKV